MVSTGKDGRRLTELRGNTKLIESALTAYAAKSGVGYPPAYGYLLPTASGKAIGELTDADYVLQPWGTFVLLNKTQDIYDKFGGTADANHDGRIGLLEYYPVGETDVVNGVTTFPGVLYNGHNLSGEVHAQNDSKQVPLRYFPVNLAQYKAARKYWLEEARDPLAQTWNPSSESLKDVTFPPTNYDAYVLVSVGPRENSFGLFGVERPGDDPANELPTGAPLQYAYHILALRAFYLATRDLNEDGLLDFDFDYYSEERELRFNVNLPGSLGSYPADNRLPSAAMPNGIGPKIFPDTVQNFAN